MHSSDSPASHSSDSVPGVNGAASSSTVPLFLGRGSPARHERFPSSPFTTPLKEKQPLSDDDEEQVLYPADTLRPRTPASTSVPIADSRPRTPYGADRDAFDREISWVASPVPQINLPIDDHDAEDDDEDYEEEGAEVPVQDEDYDEPPLSPTSANDFTQSRVYDEASPRVSASTTSIVIESEASADIHHSAPSHFPAIPLSQAASYSQNGERSPLNGEAYAADWEDRLLSRASSTKPSVEGSSPSTWEKVKNTFSRSTSSAGRRSRSNSIVNRERNSSVSRESGVSLTSGGKGERSESFTPPHHHHHHHQQQSQQPAAPPLMQSPSASASILSLAPHHAHMRGNPSPIPPVSDADRSKYQNDKLFPFPGMKKLEEQRRDRARGAFPTASASTPDVTMLAGGDEAPTPLSVQSFSSTPQTPEERKLSHQASDTRLNVKSGPDRLAASPKRQEYIDLIPLNASTSSSSSKPKLPMTFTDVKQWLSKNKGKKASVSNIAPPAPVTFSPSLESQFSTESGRQLKASLNDILQANINPSESTSDYERTPTNGQPSRGQTVNILDFRNNGRETPATSGAPTDTERTPKAKKILPLTLTSSSDSRYQAFQDTPTELSKPDRYMSPTPDPTSSLSEFPAQSTSESSSTSSQYSLGPTAQALALLQRLDDTLARGPVPVDEVPRKLLFSSPVLQVVNPNTVKDRFLFLFTDILIIAKPLIRDHGTLMETPSIIPTDRRYIVKSVVRFRDLRFCQDRVEPLPKAASPLASTRSPLLRQFVADFTHEPEQAITDLFSKSKIHDDSLLIGQVLFKTQELNRKILGEYLCKRTSKSILKAFLDNFGFTGLRIDVALRVFLHSIHIPQIHGVLEYLLDSFAGRWYEANAKSVAYDRDMAVRLVRAIGQLNELLHGAITDEVGPTGPVRRNITMKDFYDAFRRYDPRRLVSDELLEDVYSSIRHEQLSQARSQATPGIAITFKRPLPTRLTYKIQSDPIIIRLPQPDPSLTLQLFGQDLVFEPPVLNFAKSPEASFRVTGTSLGSKSLVICRSGPNAIKYAGIPLTYTIPVERAFMRNTFQIAFLNHKKVKRRYMFSVDDHLLRHQWAQSIRQQIEKSLATSPPGSENPIPGASDFMRAADEVSFKVLQETLIGQSPASLLQHGQNGHGASSQQHLSVEKDLSYNSPSHRRSKSRSKLYPRQGAGRFEFDLSTSHRYNTSQDSNETTEAEGPFDQYGKIEEKTWTSREIELQCQQNSLIPAVLSYLQSQSVTGP
ncbi:Sec7 domain-containing protein, variant 2 [Coprinopsis cinerea AmutBmut pab1-1]|nr:Sec7 domain-containing protein, variant 2 [Coprinopsis cinerea AmutBmut pab1-1]